MKNNKKLWLIASIAVAVIIAIVLCIVLLPGKEAEKPESESTVTTEQTEVNIDDPETEPDDTDSETTADNMLMIEDTDGGLTPAEEKTNANTSAGKREKAPSDTAKPVSEVKPETHKDEGGGLIIGGNTPEPYDCGVKGHHCANAETHAYVLNLEIEGCPYCGSHTCASFYATDEWGQTCYTPSKCPKYDIHSDPVYYCQTCHKPCGNGKNGTCVQYVNACNCPECGEYVESWTCHSCKK